MVVKQTNDRILERNERSHRVYSASTIECTGDDVRTRLTRLTRQRWNRPVSSNEMTKRDRVFLRGQHNPPDRIVRSWKHQVAHDDRTSPKGLAHFRSDGRSRIRHLCPKRKTHS